MPVPRARRRFLLPVAGFLALTLAAYVAHLGLGLGGSGLNWFFDNVVYDGLMMSAAGLCLARAIVARRERLAWVMIGLGLTSWFAGDVYWTLFLQNLDSPPVPSPADLMYLAFYPASYVGLLLLVRSRVAHLPRATWLDGAIAAAAVGSAVAALAFKPLLDATTGDFADVATNIGYPLGDLLLVSLVVVVLGLSGWRPSRAWLLIGGAFTLLAAADGIYLVQAATDSYVAGTLLDAMWPAAMLLVGVAAWQPAPVRAVPRVEGIRVTLVPCVSALLAVSLITYDHFQQINHVALALTAATLLLTTARMFLTFGDNTRMLAEVRAESITDSLTGLRNRRALMDDLERHGRSASEADPAGVVLFDLDGFKDYNDTFGHPAGDVLLARLGRRLGDAVAPYGQVYRLGGDEFCALIRPGTLGIDRITGLAASALAETGDAFRVTASHGAASLPFDTTDPTKALQLADRRMYAQKGGGRVSTVRQARDVLLRMLREREPLVHEHIERVTGFALGVGRAVGMSTEELDELGRAAELHDVGKMGIPAGILSKPGPLDVHERGFVERHPVIGEQILDAAPPLRPVAKIVRASHERWDGDGYPDGVHAPEIPLGARIVAVCDAYCAMISDRPYRKAMAQADAVAELERCAGSQFDPAVVEIFVEMLRSPTGAQPAATPA